MMPHSDFPAVVQTPSEPPGVDPAFEVFCASNGGKRAYLSFYTPSSLRMASAMAPACRRMASSLSASIITRARASVPE